MEGSKTIRYWDKDARIIKVSRNFTFSENGELKELQVTETPSLGAEGESTTIAAPQTIPKDNEITPEPKKQNIPDTSTQILQTQNAQIDYKQLNNPQQ